MTQVSTEDQLIIAGYVLGDLEPEEMSQVEQRLTTDANLLAEFQALQTSLWVMPQGMPLMTPPSKLRDRILAANGTIAAAPEETLSGIPSRTPEVTLEGTRAEQIPQGATIPWSKILAGLALLLALLVGADNFRLRQAIAQRSETDRVAAILQRPNSRLVALKGGDAAGTLLFTPGKWQEVVVSLGNLPPLPPDQIYRMWLTLANGQTLPCGEFNTNTEGSVFVKLTPPQTPPQGVKATGIYVTVDGVNTPLNPRGDRILSGAI